MSVGVAKQMRISGVTEQEDATITVAEMTPHTVEAAGQSVSTTLVS